jgi:hypothetical protein
MVRMMGFVSPASKNTPQVRGWMSLGRRPGLDPAFASGTRHPGTPLSMVALFLIRPLPFRRVGRA